MSTNPSSQPSTGPADGVVGLFDRVAATYDAVGVPWFGPIAEGLVEALMPRRGERALDIGCGKGAALFPLAQAVGSSGRVTGIDLSPAMVAAAAAEASGRGLRQVDVHVADASAPGLPDAEYDVVASSLVLFFLPDPGAALTAWRGLLRPGGRLGVSTFGRYDPAWTEVDEVFTPYLPEHLRDARTTGRRGPFASDEAMEDLFAAAGLVDVRTVTGSVEAVLRDPEHWHEFSWSHGQRAMWERVPEHQREAVRDRAFGLLEELRTDDGSIRFRQSVRYTLGRRG